MSSVLGFRIESRLLPHVSLPAFLSHLVPRFGIKRPSRFVSEPFGAVCRGGTRPSPFLFGPYGAAPCGDERMHVLGHLRCPSESM